MGFSRINPSRWKMPSSRLYWTVNLTFSSLKRKKRLYHSFKVKACITDEMLNSMSKILDDWLTSKIRVDRQLTPYRAALPLAGKGNGRPQDSKANQKEFHRDVDDLESRHLLNVWVAMEDCDARPLVFVKPIALTALTKKTHAL
jgi:hypothetical protein